MVQWILFIVVSLILIAISWKSLRQPGSHGFYRFFAWEAILALFVINMNVWFYKPFAWNQIIAWALLILCVIPLVFGVHSLRTRGKPAQQRAGDPALLAFEKTTALVTSGIYHYIRHPLYSSLFLLAWGIFFKSPSLPGAALAVAATLFLIATAKADETESTRFFGAQYQEYMKSTRMFVPYIF
ncbi:MAG: isoprenylcysteine carboxylmethyltransferase family protein [Chloroflexi bacterium]|nr:MAG: isoprenylcysteine carboxylmethyltransferase family protein [Chloroflexota bacterium]